VITTLADSSTESAACCSLLQPRQENVAVGEKRRQGTEIGHRPERPTMRNSDRAIKNILTNELMKEDDRALRQFLVESVLGSVWNTGMLLAMRTRRTKSTRASEHHGSLTRWSH